MLGHNSGCGPNSKQSVLCSYSVGKRTRAGLAYKALQSCYLIGYFGRANYITDRFRVICNRSYSLLGDETGIFFLKVFGGHTCPFLGPMEPLFWISGDVSSGVQSQSGFCLIRFLQRSTSGATLADLLVASVQPVLSPHTVAEVGLDFHVTFM